MSDPLQDYCLFYIKPCQGLLLLRPSRAPQKTAVPSSHLSKAFVGGKIIKHYPNVWGHWEALKSQALVSIWGGYILGVQEKGSLVIPPNSKSYRAQPHPSTYLQTSPPTATSLLKTGDTFLPTYLSYFPLRSWSPILKGANLGVHPSHFGVQEKRVAQSHRWPPSSQLAQGLGGALGRGTPTRELWRGSSTPSQNWGHPPQNPSQPIRLQLGGRGSALQCPSQVPPTLHSSPHLEGSRGPQKIPKKSRMLGRRSWTSYPNLGSLDTPVFPGKFCLSPASRQPCSVPMPILEVTPSLLPPPRVSRPPRWGAGVQDTWLPDRGTLFRGLGAKRSSSLPLSQGSRKARSSPPLPSPLAGLGGGLGKPGGLESAIAIAQAGFFFFSLGWGGGRWEGERGGEPKRTGT